MNQSWPFPEKSFDAVTIVWGNRYIVDPRHFANEVSRVLKPGGVIVWPIFWLEIPFWWLFALKSRGISQLFSLLQFTVGGVAKTLRMNAFDSIEVQPSQLRKKVGFWQKPKYVVGVKPKIE